MSYEWMENPQRGPEYEALIPEAILDGIRWYVEKGVPCGGFLTACLENDLREAFGRADVNSRASLFDIVKLLYNEIPSPARGSPEKVKAWLEKFREVPA